jgi:cell division protein FtsW
VARPLILLFLAAHAARHQGRLREGFAALRLPLAVLGAACVLLAAEPDFGDTFVLAACGLAVLFLAGARLRDLARAGGLAAFAGVLLSCLSRHGLARIRSFLDPWADPYHGGFQLTQSLIAIGRGEWLGAGLGNGVHKLFYLPEAHTDFMLASLAEELGLAGVLVTVLLFLVLTARSFVTARRACAAGLTFQGLLAACFGLWLGLQAFINMGVNMGVLPTKGLTLPLMSYGRTSLIVTLAGVGVLMRVHHEARACALGARHG